MNSPLTSEMRPGDSGISCTGQSRSPFGPNIRATALAATSPGTESAAGEPLQRLPAMVARPCTCVEPISSNPSTTPGQRATTPAWLPSSAPDTAAPMRKPPASGVYFRVGKSTLLRRAVADTPYANLADKMVGPLAYGIGPDPVAVAKVLSDFAKGNEKFVIAGGAMPGQVMSAKEIASLASLPSRNELLAKLLGTMQAPVVKLVRTMNEVPSKFVRTLAAVRDATKPHETLLVVGRQHQSCL